jgi:hypothetical protein
MSETPMTVKTERHRHAPVVWLPPTLFDDRYPFICACGVTVWCTARQRLRHARGLRVVAERHWRALDAVFNRR